MTPKLLIPTFLALIVTATLGLALGALQQQPADAAPERGTLRVMSYNIHHGAGTDGVVDLQRIARIILEADVDLVALQEVDLNLDRSGGVDQAAELARLTGMHGVFGKARDIRDGEYGQAILTRRPIAEVVVRPLRAEGTEPPTGDVEERIAVIATIAADGDEPPLRFVSTHLHHREESLRLDQARVLDALLNTPDGPGNVIIAGDLNAVDGSETMQFLGQAWTNVSGEAATFPAGAPDRKIDWVLVQKSGPWRAVSAEVLAEPVASDHRPVVVELRR